MSGVSDVIASFILSMLEDQDGVELRRNELAQYFGCAPSQINYVLTTRFSVDHGYVVNSKRGGGGYILIRRIPAESRSLQSCLTEQVGQEISLARARALLQNLEQNGLLSKREAAMMAAAVNNIPMLSAQLQDYARSHLLKNMLLALLGGSCGQKANESKNKSNAEGDGSLPQEV